MKTVTVQANSGVTGWQGWWARTDVMGNLIALVVLLFENALPEAAGSNPSAPSKQVYG